MSESTDLHVLLAGYNGANNTCAEARLMTIISDVRGVFGPNVSITIPTLNERNLRRYLKEDPRLNVAPMSPVFLFDSRSLDVLVTSRYHAGVLSLAAHVPQVAVGHDQRLADLYRDLGLLVRTWSGTSFVIPIVG